MNIFNELEREENKMADIAMQAALDKFIKGFSR